MRTPPRRPPAMTNIPDWVIDEVLQPAKPIAFRLVVLLFRHGRPVVDANGNRRVYWRGSTQELARLVGASKPHILAAEHQLEERGFLVLHKRTHNNAPHALSAPVERAGGNNLLPLSDSDFDTYGDAIAPDPPIREDESIITSSNDPAVTICNRLAAYGVTTPERWLREFDRERIAIALDILDEAADTRTVHNPGGFLRSLITTRAPLRRPVLAAEDSFEARKRRYS